jgi:nitrate reductase gamma subunit
MEFWDGFFLGLILLSALWALSALLFVWFSARAYGKRELFAKAAGSANLGAAYAFTVGMLPWAKESIRENLLSYAMGIAYHLGIFTAFAITAINTVYSIFPAALFPSFGHPYPKIVTISFLLLLAMGVIGGISLFVKRIVNPTLRGISCPDDYISNFLATSFVSLALLSILAGEAWASRIWLACTIVLLAYIPFSKIRHCLFFFSTRYHFGAFFGRRGCMPPSK